MTYSSLGPGPKYSVSALFVSATSELSVPLVGCRPGSTQCLQKANSGLSGVGASGSTSINRYDAAGDPSACGERAKLVSL